MRKFSFLVLFCISLNILSQEEVAKFKNNIDDSSLSIKEVIPVVNSKTNDISVFVLNSKQVFGYLLNEDFQVLKSLSSEDRRRKYKTLIGYSIKDKFNYDVYLTNKNKTKFASVNFSYENGTSQLKEFKLDDPYESFIQTVTIDNTCYLISVLMGSNILKLYKLNGVNDVDVTEFDLSEESFTHGDWSKVKLHTLFRLNGQGRVVNIQTNQIEDYLPNSIEVVSEAKKLYVREGKIVFTFDNNADLFQVLTIDPVNKSYDFKSTEKKLLKSKQPEKRSNTFLGGDKLYTFAVSKDSLGFRVQDYNSKEIIKELFVGKEDSIRFKNTSIVQEGGVYDSHRELEGTQKFLRKLRLADIGVSVYNQHGIFEITFGSKKDTSRGGVPMMMPMGAGIPIVPLGAANMFFNSTFFAYNSYTSTKSVFVKSLFDKDFNHLEGDIVDNVFDKMKDYPSEDTLEEAKTIFRYKDYFILGNYYEDTKTYSFIKFEG